MDLQSSSSSRMNKRRIQDYFHSLDSSRASRAPKRRATPIANPRTDSEEDETASDEEEEPRPKRRTARPKKHKTRIDPKAIVQGYSSLSILQTHTIQSTPPPANEAEDETNPSTFKQKQPKIALPTSHASLFTAPPGSLLIHACNGAGIWGAGVAAHFATHYPHAHAAYRAHCAAHTPASLLGTALLIPPQPAGVYPREQADWIGCVFTREKPGFASRGAAALEKEARRTLAATESAFAALLAVLAGREGAGDTVGLACMPRINAGLFRVEWARTEAVLARCGGPGLRGEVHVYVA